MHALTEIKNPTINTCSIIYVIFYFYSSAHKVYVGYIGDPKSVQQHKHKKENEHNAVITNTLLIPITSKHQYAL